MKILVVGAGFAGAVVARELAEDGHNITVIDKRLRLGGNTAEYYNSRGIRVHEFGPHIFHTNSEQAYNWVIRFGEWTEYKHKVKAQLT